MEDDDGVVWKSSPATSRLERVSNALRYQGAVPQIDDMLKVGLLWCACEDVGGW